MKIIFFLHWEFQEKEVDFRDWFRKYEQELKKKGHQVILFDAETHQFRDSDVVHLFSDTDSEMWESVRSFQGHLVVTPALAKEPEWESRGSHLKDFWVRLFRGMTQRRWPPVDEIRWYRSPKRFLVFDPRWSLYLSQSRRIPFRKIHLLSKDPRQAADAAEKIYNEVIAQRLSQTP